MDFIEYMVKKTNEKEEKTKPSNVTQKTISPIEQHKINEILKQIQKGKLH